MRHTIKNVNAVHPLKNITRRSNGWQVQKRINDVHFDEYFSDTEHGNSYSALNAAIRFRNKKFGDPMAEVRSPVQVRLNSYGRPSTYLPKFEQGKSFMIKSDSNRPAVYRAAKNYGYNVKINGFKVTVL